MARVTVEDCLKKIPNRFEMVLSAAARARQLSSGTGPRIDSKDKPTVVALLVLLKNSKQPKCLTVGDLLDRW